MKPVSSSAGFLLGQVSVTFDLVKKQPSGQQTFTLMTKDGASGSLTTEVRHPSQQWTHTYAHMRAIFSF